MHGCPVPRSQQAFCRAPRKRFSSRHGTQHQFQMSRTSPRKMGIVCLSAAGEAGVALHSLCLHLVSSVCPWLGRARCSTCFPSQKNGRGIQHARRCQKLSVGEGRQLQSSPATGTVPCFACCKTICISMSPGKNLICGALFSSDCSRCQQRAEENSLSCGSKLKGCSEKPSRRRPGKLVGEGRAADGSNSHGNLPFPEQNVRCSNAKPPNARVIRLHGGGSGPCHGPSPLRTTKCLFLNCSFSFDEEGWKSDK